MNIFFLHPNPTRCARWHCDRHVVKMILETTQLLYTAHWMLAIADNRLPSFRTAPHPVAQPKMRGYLPISNAKHPCALWTRESLQHYRWLCLLGLALCLEFRHRFGEKAHSCERHLLWLYWNAPPELADNGWTQPPKAMPIEHKRSNNTVVCYRNYYVESKGRDRGLLTYTRRHRPHWVPVTA